jgi:hypothetical protein
MLGRKSLTTDVTLTAPTDFVTAQLAAGELALGFQVEEQEMLVDLEARLCYEGSAAGLLTFTFFVDGAASSDLPAAGLWRTEVVAETVGAQQTAYPRATLRLAKGFHRVEVRASASAGNVVFLGAAGVPCELVARRHSHPATLGHGVDSKALLIQ